MCVFLEYDNSWSNFLITQILGFKCIFNRGCNIPLNDNSLAMAGQSSFNKTGVFENLRVR